MLRISIAILTFVLSGVPVAAVLCDVFVCPQPASSSTSTSQNCHAHKPAGSDDRVSATTGGCAHLSLVDPFVPSAVRFTTSDVTAVLTTAVPGPTAVSAWRATRSAAHGPPPASPSSHITPLRI